MNTYQNNQQPQYNASQGGYQAPPYGYQQPYNQAPVQNGYSQQLNTPANHQENRRRSFFDAVTAVDSNQRTYLSVAIEGIVSNVQPTKITQNNHKIVRFSMAIDGHAEYIQKLTGIMPEADQNGRVWVRITVWDKTADRFENFFAKHPSCVVMVFGSLVLQEETGQNGMVYRRPEINCRTFNFVRDIVSKNENQDKKQHQAPPVTQPQYNPAPAQPVNSYQAPPIQPQYNAASPQPMNGYQTPPATQPQYNPAPVQPANGYQKPSQPQYNAASPQPVNNYQTPPANQPQYTPAPAQPVNGYQVPNQPANGYQASPTNQPQDDGGDPTLAFPYDMENPFALDGLENEFAES